MSSFVSAQQSCQTNSCSSSSFAVVGIHHRVCIDNIQQGIIQLYIEQKGSMMTWVPDFSQQIPIRQLFWWDLWPTESKGGDKAIITNCLLQTRAPCPEIRDIRSYSFECNEKSSGALNKPSRNYEFCQPECLKSLLDACAVFAVEFWISGLTWLTFMKKNAELYQKYYLKSWNTYLFINFG